METFPEDWREGVVVVAHPDDIEYGLAAAVARWTDEGRRVTYLLATRGEEGIAGMPAEQAGPLREDEQRRSSAVVGVSEVDFLGFPDSRLADDDALRAALAEAFTARRPDLVVAGYFGPAWGPGKPNQSDHMEVGRAVAHATAELGLPLYQQDLAGDLVVDVEDQFERAVAALTEHRVYLEVLDPETPVAVQSRRQVELGCPTQDVLGGRRGVTLSRVHEGR